jgi:hypothetical protein
MSYYGLFRKRLEILNEINILDTFIAQIKGQRGYGKPCRNNIICMDIDMFELEGCIIKNHLEQDYIEGLVIKINQEDFPKLCYREGYNKGEEIISSFSNYKSIGEELWNLFQDNKENDFFASIRKYREKLNNKIGYTSSNYIPHPVYLKNLGYAIVFIAPGKYGTGNANQQSIKDEEGIFNLMNVSQVLKRKDVDEKKFLEYTLECLYGGVHGINVRDIIELINDSDFMKAIQKNLNQESINKEKSQFGCKIFGNLEKYRQKFGELDQNLTRSGLKSIL